MLNTLGINLSLSTLYVDDDLLILDKPPGISVLVEGWDPSRPNLTDQARKEFGPIWVVHRLDKSTSGVIVFARNAGSHRNMNTQFQEHRVVKGYHAILDGRPDWCEMTAGHPLRMDAGHSHRTKVDLKDGKPSNTFFRVINLFNRHCLVEAMPRTGRTHQIRAHASALGFPILGDHLYSASPTTLIDRPALHAFSIQFIHPLTNLPMSISCLYPPDFTQALALLKSGVE